ALPKRGSSSPEPASDSPSFRAGEKVRHAKFGEGEILESGAGKVVVRFGSDVKTLVPELARLSKV
ncbi:MAG TPA: hypothetical protein VFJ72_16715, partial [Rubrobacteraceae bacterium]|nr:hypothetical protein [Rubrobacteraceae bacterium]